MDGTIINPIKDDNYFIFLKPFKVTEQFKQQRENNLNKLKDIEKKQTLFQPHEETMNDVLLQYMGYFRTK